jgi:XTP/dITP diphosphohydrolase
VSSATVVLVDPRLGPVLPAAALAAIRAADAVYLGTDLPETFVAALGVDPAPVGAIDGAVVLIVADRAEPAAAELLAGEAALIETAPPTGVEVLGAVTVMDRLRSPGGCPWDAEQTHESLLQYLVEETWELVEAIEDADRPALREELGDVLLQVLFHARLAAEYAEDPFTIDEVAADLVGKLVHRHPHVFVEPGDAEVSDLEHRWEVQKRLEKKRESSVDGVALGQPALNLVAKLVSRTQRSGLPPDLLPDEPLFAVAAKEKLAGGEPEGDLRRVARRFAADVRAAERAARAAGIDPVHMDAELWRKFWPAR